MTTTASRWRRSLGLAAGVSMLAVSIASAGEVTIWCWDPNFNGATMKEAAARYTAAHPETTFNIVDFAKADLEQKLQAQLASGTTDGLPDIVLIEDYGASLGEALNLVLRGRHARLAACDHATAALETPPAGATVISGLSQARMGAHWFD